MDDHKSVTATFQVDPASLLTAVLLDGLPTGMVGSSFTFTATVLPVTALTPITYTWQVGGQDPITRTGGLTDTITFVWGDWGKEMVTVTAVNDVSEPVTASLVVNVLPWRLYLPVIHKAQ